MFMSKLCRCCCGKNIKNLTGNLMLLAVKSRLDILFHLKEKKYFVCDLMMHTKMSQSLISHHLSDLTKAGLVKGERQGKYVEYSLTAKGEKIIKCLQFMLETGKGGEEKNGRR